MPPHLVERFVKLGSAAKLPSGAPLLTAAFAEVYGMVELSGPAIVKLTPARPVEGLRSARLWKRVKGLLSRGGEPMGARGVPIPPYRARVVGADGRQLPRGQVGELTLKGPGVMRGYDAGGGPRDGWLHTGDLAREGPLGLIEFVTRKKDVVKHGGFSVFPAEVEAQLCEHPAVAEAIVFGAPHPT